MRVSPSGAVLEPLSGAFDVVVAPGEDVQAAVDSCPPGGCVLLLPGTHEGPLVLLADQEVHVFGRGQAVLRADGAVLIIRAEKATVDGVAVRCESGYGHGDCGVWINGGRMRLQACNVTSASDACVRISGGDPILASCT